MVTAALEFMPHISTLQEIEYCRALRLVDNLGFLIKLSGKRKEKTERPVLRSWAFPVLGRTLGKAVSGGWEGREEAAYAQRIDHVVPSLSSVVVTLL